MTDTSLLKSVAERGSTASDRKALQRFDWLLKALEVFVAEGIDAVRITRLASDLGVTRGSFYWHFKNRADLIEALVDYWKVHNTATVVDSVQQAPSLSRGIFAFFETCLNPDLFDSRLDLAIREWARRSSDIRAELDLADDTRVQAITAFYLRFGYPMPEALIRARVLYFAQIGFYALDVREPLETRVYYSEAYYLSFTGQVLDPAEAEYFRQNILAKYGEYLP